MNLISDAAYPPSHTEGAQDASVYVAALITVAAWLGTWRITTTTRLRRWPPLLVLVFAVLDIAALLALWSCSPAIWGPEHCCSRLGRVLRLAKSMAALGASSFGDGWRPGDLEVLVQAMHMTP